MGSCVAALEPPYDHTAVWCDVCAPEVVQLRNPHPVPQCRDKCQVIAPVARVRYLEQPAEFVFRKVVHVIRPLYGYNFTAVYVHIQDTQW